MNNPLVHQKNKPETQSAEDLVKMLPEYIINSILDIDEEEKPISKANHDDKEHAEDKQT